MTVLDYALTYLDSGISVIPIARDGTKTPASELLPQMQDPDTGTFKRTWKPFQQEPAERGQVERWFDREQPPGIAAVCGNGSACGLEVIDFDAEADTLFPQWCEVVREQSPTLLDRVTVIKTPGGYHVWMTCPDIDVPGNQKLAMAGPRQVLIETRGQGGYALVPGCPAECHPSGKTYEHYSGVRLEQIPTVSIDEHDLLINCARLFDRTPVAEPAPAAKPSRVDRPADSISPGTDFEQRGPDWVEILEPHGWKRVGGSQGSTLWRRPGKAIGWSATTGRCHGQDGADLLRVFSSNAHPFEDGKAYGRFRAYSILNHDGDLSAAAKELASQGYGDQSPPRRVANRPVQQSASERPAVPAAAKSAEPVRPRPLDPWVPFPVNHLPLPIKEFVVAGALALGCDPAYLAMPALGVCAGAIGNSRAIRIKSSWTEPAVLWTVVVGDSGTLKTPAYSLALKPLADAGKESRNDFRGKIASWRTEHDEWKRRAKERRAKGEEVPDEPEKPTLNRYYVKDVTIECLAEILEDNPRGVLVTRDELNAWFASFRRYKSQGGTDVSQWLELYSAGSITIDRKTGDRRSVQVDHASVSVTGGIQPGTLAKTITAEHFESGLVARL